MRDAPRCVKQFCSDVFEITLILTNHWGKVGSYQIFTLKVLWVAWWRSTKISFIKVFPQMKFNLCSFWGNNFLNNYKTNFWTQVIGKRLLHKRLLEDWKMQKERCNRKTWTHTAAPVFIRIWCEVWFLRRDVAWQLFKLSVLLPGGDFVPWRSKFFTPKSFSDVVNVCTLEANLWASNTNDAFAA